MSDSTIWWLLAGVAAGLELFSGTFFLLMIALGMVAAALAAHAGAGFALQLVSAAVVGSAALVAWYLVRKRRQSIPSVDALHSASLDVGEVVYIEEWLPDGTARVKYRGAQWSAIQQPGLTQQTGTHRVVELVGNRLRVEKL